MKVNKCLVNGNEITSSGYSRYTQDVWKRVLEIFQQVKDVPFNLCDLHLWSLNGVTNEYYTERFLPDERTVAIRVLSLEENPEIGAEIIIMKDDRAVVFHVEHIDPEHKDALKIVKEMNARREEYLKQENGEFIKEVLY